MLYQASCSAVTAAISFAGSSGITEDASLPSDGVYVGSLKRVAGLTARQGRFGKKNCMLRLSQRLTMPGSERTPFYRNYMRTSDQFLRKIQTPSLQRLMKRLSRNRWSCLMLVRTRARLTRLVM